MHLALNDDNEPIKDPIEEEAEMEEEKEVCTHRHRLLIGRMPSTNFWKCTDCKEQWSVTKNA